MLDWPTKLFFEPAMSRLPLIINGVPAFRTIYSDRASFPLFIVFMVSQLGLAGRERPLMLLSIFPSCRSVDPPYRYVQTL
jgi:hypothetical protein